MISVIIIFAGVLAYYMAKSDKKLLKMYGDKPIDRPE
jgi:hypothetical protein